MKFPASSSAILLSGIVAMAIADAARADIVYSYTGSNYTQFYSPYYYSGAQKETISFTVASALGDNFSGLVTPISFTGSDGVTDIPAGATGYFDITTDASGQIKDWTVFLTYSTNTGGGASQTIYSSDVDTTGYPDPDTPGKIDQAEIFGCANEGCEETSEAQVSNVSSPGSWSSAPNSSSAPEPTGWMMLLLGVGGIGALRRSRRRAHSMA